MSDDIDTRRMNIASIGLALDQHQAHGLVKSWALVEGGNDLCWRVKLAGRMAWHDIEARGKREIGLLLAGLTAAAEAIIKEVKSHEHTS
jgi:hypothetical protein